MGAAQVESFFPPERVGAMAAALTTTDAYAGVPESHITVEGHNRLDYLVTETAAANGITAKVVGRYLRKNGEVSAWQDAAGERAVAASGTTIFSLTDLAYDEYAVEIRATVGASQGDVQVYGGSRLVQERGTAAADSPKLTRSIAAEAADVVTTSLQSSRQETTLIHITGYTGVQAAAGDLVEAADAALTMSDGTTGTTLSGDDTHAALFATDTAGALDVAATDVAGASSLEFLLIAREGSADGPILDLFVISFDGA